MSREDVVVARPWNKKLLLSVAELFVDAMEIFVRANIFPYEWLTYLPGVEQDGFWKSLWNDIRDRLLELRILQRVGGTGLGQCRELRILPQSFLIDGVPLFGDPLAPSAVYLANDYIELGLKDKLIRLGVPAMTWSEVLQRAESDLPFDPNGEIFSSARDMNVLDDAWNAQFIQLAIIINGVAGGSGEMDDSEEQEHSVGMTEAERSGLSTRLKCLKMIPLRRVWDSDPRCWISGSENVYFPYVEDQEIPTTINIRTVDPKALRIPDSTQLYRALGVCDCAPPIVTGSILTFNENVANGQRYPVDSWISQLRFLHRWPPENLDLIEALSKVRLMTSKKRRIFRSRGLYFASEGQYSAWKLLEALPAAVVQSEGFNDDIFLHELYLQNPPRDTYSGRTWTAFLKECAFIRDHPPLVDSKSPAFLSPILSIVLQTNSKLFLGAMQHHWISSYREEYNRHPEVQSTLRDLHVSCTDGSSTALCHTFFANDKLLRKSEQIGIQSLLPFLSIPEDLSDPDSWKFLEKMGVHFELDLEFYFRGLLAIQGQTGQSDEDIVASLIILYEGIGKMANSENGETISVRLNLPHTINLS